MVNHKLEACRHDYMRLWGDIQTNHKIPPWAPKNSCISFMQNTFSSSPRVVKVLTVSAKVQIPTLLWDLRQTHCCESLYKWKVKHFQNSMAQNKHCHSKRYKQVQYKAMGPKQVQNPAGQTLSPVVPCGTSRAICGKLWYTKGLCNSPPVALLVIVAPRAFLLDILCSTLAALLRWSVFLAFANFWGLHCTFDFTLTDLHCPFRGTLPGPQAFFWNLGGSLFNFRILAFCMHLKPVPHGWCQGLQSAATYLGFPLSWL